MLHKTFMFALVMIGLAAFPAVSLSRTSTGEQNRVVVQVSLSNQSMTVYHNGASIYEWAVSTARTGKVTPKGSWKAKWLSRDHRSSLYNNAPMPYSIFYNGNFAVHGTDQIDRLGSPASAGCIRLHPSNAAILFQLVQDVGLQNTSITVAD